MIHLFILSDTTKEEGGKTSLYGNSVPPVRYRWLVPVPEQKAAELHARTREGPTRVQLLLRVTEDGWHMKHVRFQAAWCGVSLLSLMPCSSTGTPTRGDRESCGGHSQLS